MPAIFLGPIGAQKQTEIRTESAGIPVYMYMQNHTLLSVRYHAPVISIIPQTSCMLSITTCILITVYCLVMQNCT